MWTVMRGWRANVVGWRRGGRDTAKAAPVLVVANQAGTRHPEMTIACAGSTLLVPPSLVMNVGARHSNVLEPSSASFFFSEGVRRRGGRGPNFRIVLFWVRDEREGPIAVKDRRLGTDRRRSRQRTVFVSDVSYATVYLVRNALAGIERATCSTDRLAVRTASCGSRRERFAARRVGEHVSSDVSLCTSYQS